MNRSAASPVQEIVCAEQRLRRLQSVAEEEADCILRATTRRAKGALGSSQASEQAASTATKPRQKAAKAPSHDVPSSTSPSEQREGSRELSDTDMVAWDSGAGGTSAEEAPLDDLALTTSCETPAPRRCPQPQEDVEADGADMSAAPTPMLPMTARRKGRFAAMQTLQVSATAYGAFIGQDSLAGNECKQAAKLFIEGCMRPFQTSITG